MGCSINPLSWGGCVGDALGSAAGGLASAGFDAVVGEFAKGLAMIVKTLATFWISVPTEKVSSAPATPVGMLNAMLDWVMLAVGVLSILLVAARIALTHRGEALADAGTGIVRFILVTSVQVPAVALLAAAGDEFSRWIIDTAAGGDFADRVGQVFGSPSATSVLGTAVLFIACLFGIVTSLVQVIAMVFRNGVLILTAAASPIAAAAAIYKGNEDMWRKLWMWQLAFVLYKPVAATIYAAAFVTIGDGTSAVDELSGLALLILSVLALPALLRLMMPVSARMSPGGGGAALAGAVIAASGAASVVTSRRGGRNGGNGGGSGGGSPSPPGPSGASGVNTSAGGGTGAASGGAVAAAGPPGMAAGAAVQAGAQAVGVVKGMADSAAATPGSSATQEQ